MQKRLNHFMLLLMVVMVIISSTVGTTTVYADDGSSTEETSEPAQEETTPETGTDVVESSTPEVDTLIVTEPALVEESAPVDSVEEIMAQIPDGTELIVVSETGIEPLASEEAAQIILTGDPIWCPDGATPTSGANGCTDSFATFTELITTLISDNGITYNGNGVIWVAGDYTNADDSPIIFDGTTLSWFDNLAFTGGWSGISGDDAVDNADYSELDVSLSIINWHGNVTLSNLSIDAEDAVAGLYVETTGDISLSNIVSSGNSLGYGAGLDTCVYDAALEQCSGTGDVIVQDSTFDDNTGGSGIGIDSGGTVSLDTVQASGNDFAGAEVYNFDLLNTGGVQITDSIFNNNGDNGIWVNSEGAITMTNTDATGNGFDGADLINYEGSGDVTVSGGDFSDNDEAGLYIASNGNVFISDVISNGNKDGADVDNAYGEGTVNVTDSTFDNNTWTGLYVTSAGSIALDNIGASHNGVIGAYLNGMNGDGNIDITGATFTENGDWGMKAFAGNGDITLMDVLIDGNGNSENGAWVKSYDGNVWIENSLFTENVNLGLLTVAGGQVDLVNVTVTANGGNGVEAYSTYTFACFGSEDILVNVDSGIYSNNGKYGIYTEPGTDGNLTLINSPEFSDNGLGDTFIEKIKDPCPPQDPSDDDDDGKPTNEIIIPEDGDGEPVLQDCENFSSTTLQLHTGTSVEVGCPFTGSSQLSETSEGDLPDRLPVGLTFGSAITVGLDDEGNPIPVMTEGGLLTLTFVIPEELIGKRMSILYWDPQAKDGAGDWVELPLEQYGGASFPLYPDDADDGRMICSGFEQSGNTVTVTVNFPGIFVLVAR